MATILLTWELGSGLGHVTQLAALGGVLLRRGHRLVAALRNPLRADMLFKPLEIPLLQAPILTERREDRIDPLLSAAHILHNIGFSQPNLLASLLAGWDAILRSVEPDLVVLDHSPTAIVALRGSSVRTVTLGTGFFSPPDIEPLPSFLSLPPADDIRLRSDEDRVRDNVNQVLRSRGVSPLSRLSRLFHDVDQVILTTFRELDHYPQRHPTHYWGGFWDGVGEPAEWPDGPGRRIFAYLKPRAAVPALLNALRWFQHPTIAVLDGHFDKRTTETNGTSLLHIYSHPIDLRPMARHCDLAILSAGHASTVAMLLSGKPSLLIPTTMEQYLFAQRVQLLGAGRCAHPADPAGVVRALEDLLQSPTYQSSAETFACRYRGFDPKELLEAIADQIEELLRT